MKDEQDYSSGHGVGRRELMKIGAGAVMGTLAGRATLAGPQADDSATMDVVEVGTGWKNDANRLHGNGPMDDTTRKLVAYVKSFSEKQMTESVNAAVGRTMLDSMAALISGFEAEPVRIAARIARMNHCDLKSTVFGYGVTSTTPELAAFANSCMIRHTDYNDMEPPAGSHSSVMIPGILAVGEALHSTGAQVMMATTLAYEILFAMGRATVHRKVQLDGPYEGMATALACGKLMGLDEDRLANAMSLALVPHLPMGVSHTGALSHWKGCHSGMGVRGGVFGAMMAREGMTGPSQPIEGRAGLWDTITGPFEFKIPVDDSKLTMEVMTFKRFPAEGGNMLTLDQFVPRVREWTKIEDIAAIEVEEPMSSILETGDPPKWDPKNRETADHSYAYVMAVGLIDGDVYLQSFKPERYLEDQAVKQLMSKITLHPNPEFRTPRKRIVVRKKSGEEQVTDLFKDRPMTHEEIVAKFNRVCAYMSVSDQQRDRAMKDWQNLREVKDIAEPIRNLASFGKPQPL